MPKKIIKGKITSDKMNKTVVVSVEMSKKHKVYKKTIRETRRFNARNEIGAKLGDQVAIEECPPLSKTVTWRVVKNFTDIEKK